MKGQRIIYFGLNAAIALVWLINGLFCKALNLIPRHQLIVSRILGGTHASFITKVIGILETLMAVWILSRIQSRLCAVVQIVVIATMNTIEFFVVPDLLLFGRINAAVAAFFIIVIAMNEFVLRRKPEVQTN